MPQEIKKKKNSKKETLGEDALLGMPEKANTQNDDTPKEVPSKGAPSKGASRKARIASEKIIGLNEDGKISGEYKEDGLIFKYTLNRQKEGFYLAKGTLSLLDPYGQRETIKFFDSKTGESICASEPLHIRWPKKDEELVDLIDSEIGRVSQKLKYKYQGQYSQYQQGGKNLSEMTFCEAEIAFLADASKSVSEKSTSRKNFCSSIRKFSKALQDVKIKKVKKADLKRVCASCKDGEKILKDLKKFIVFVETLQMMSSGLLPVVEGVLHSILSEDDSGKRERNKKEASNSDVLSNEAEGQLNQRLFENVSDPRYVCFGSIKGSGLDLTETCELKTEQVQRYLLDRTIMFLKIKRSYAGSATQDYTFPIFPFEAILLNDYIDALIKTEGKARMDEGKYLFSSDGGQTPIKSSEVAGICRMELMRLKFGYADLIGKVDLQKNKGVELLKKTYIERLEKWGGLDKSKDEGAFLFMTHKSLGNKVQADHYRGFTGESGREFLINITQQDKRFLAMVETPAKKRKEGKGCRIKGERKEYVLQRKDQKNTQQSIVYLTLNPHELAAFSAMHGCEVIVEEIEYLDENPGSEALATAQLAKIGSS